MNPDIQGEGRRPFPHLHGVHAVARAMQTPFSRHIPEEANEGDLGERFQKKMIGVCRRICLACLFVFDGLFLL